MWMIKKEEEEASFDIYPANLKIETWIWVSMAQIWVIIFLAC